MKRFSLWRVALVASVAMIAGWMGTASAEAGTCARFCIPTLVGSDVVRTAGGACTRASECSSLECDSFYSIATDDQIRAYCRNAGPEVLELNGRRTTVDSARWCDDFLGVSSPAMRQETFDGRCAIPYTGQDEVRGPVTVTAEPAPEPARPGDRFRCRYLCLGESQPRDGGSCVAATDQSACVRECQMVCGGESCAGTFNGGAFRNDPNSLNTRPICIPTRPESAPASTAPATSVGGIRDTGRIEPINEVFSSLSITAFIGAVVKTLIGLAGALFLLMLLWAGFRWTTSGGDQKGVAAAQTTLRNAVIGMIVVATSYVLVTAVIELFSRATTLAS